MTSHVTIDAHGNSIPVLATALTTAIGTHVGRPHTNDARPASRGRKTVGPRNRDPCTLSALIFQSTLPMLAGALLRSSSRCLFVRRDWQLAEYRRYDSIVLDSLWNRQKRRSKACDARCARRTQ